MNYRAGLTWQAPDGEMGSFIPKDRWDFIYARREAVEVDRSKSIKGVVYGREDGRKWEELEALGWRIVPVVMVEVPESRENCPLCCYGCPWAQSGHDCSCNGGPDCPAGRGK